MEKSYIDSNIFLFAALDNGIKGKKAKEIINKKNIYTSTLTFDEFAYKILKVLNKDDAINIIDAFLNLQVTFIEVNQNIIWNAFELIKKNSIDPRDAIHASCAISNNIKTILSEDKDFDKVREINRKSL